VQEKAEIALVAGSDNLALPNPFSSAKVSQKKRKTEIFAKYIT